MGDSDEGVSFSKPDAGATPDEPPFDPYRFGKPEQPIPAEYAPPGYTGPTIPAGAPYPPPGPVPPGFEQSGPGQPYAPYGAGPYGPPPPPYQYGAPPPPPYHGYPTPPAGNGKAVAGLVFGILSIVLCLLSLFDGVLVILGLIFSLIALGESKDRRGSGRGLAIAGLVCTIIGGLLATLMTVIYVRVSNNCDGLQDNRSEMQTCIRDHVF